MLARMISALVGFPQAGKQVPVSVTFTPEKGKERWTRNFGGRRFSSTQSAGMGKDRYLLAERFGIVTVALALVLDGGRLALIPGDGMFWACRCPAFFCRRARVSSPRKTAGSASMWKFLCPSSVSSSLIRARWNRPPVLRNIAAPVKRFAALHRVRRREGRDAFPHWGRAGARIRGRAFLLLAVQNV